MEDGCPGCAVSFSPLHKSIKQLEKAAMKIHMEKKVCEQKSHWKAAFTEISSYKTSTFLMTIGAASREMGPKHEGTHTEGQRDERPIDDGRASLHQRRRARGETVVQTHGE